MNLNFSYVLHGVNCCTFDITILGKTAAFMLPILERLLFRPKQVPVTRVLVLAPTRELAIQVMYLLLYAQPYYFHSHIHAV